MLEEFAADLVMSAGSAMYDTVKYGGTIVVTLYIDERSPFVPPPSSSSARTGPARVGWELRTKLPLRHPTQILTFLRAVGHDERLAAQVDMELFMFAKRVPVVGGASSAFDSMALDATRLVSELGIRAGDELELILDENAVQLKKQRLQQVASASSAVNQRMEMSSSRASLFSANSGRGGGGGGSGTTPPSSPFRNAIMDGSISSRSGGAAGASHRSFSVMGASSSPQHFLFGGSNRSPREASTSRYSPHTPSFAFQRNNRDDGYETPVDAAGWPLMGAGGGGTMNQILQRAREETHEIVGEQRRGAPTSSGGGGGGLPPRSAVVRPVVGSPGGALDPRLQQLLDNAYARQATAQQQQRDDDDNDDGYGEDMEQSRRSLTSNNVTATAAITTNHGGGTLRDIMQRAQLGTTTQRPPPAAPSGPLDPRLQQLLDKANSMYGSLPQQQDTTRYYDNDDDNGDDDYEKTSDDYNYNMEEEYAQVERRELARRLPQQQQLVGSGTGGGGLRAIMNAAKAQNVGQSKEGLRDIMNSAKSQSSSVAQARQQSKNSTGLDPQLQQLLDNAKQYQHYNNAEDDFDNGGEQYHDEMDEELSVNGSPNGFYGAAAGSTGAGGLRGLMQRAQNESHHHSRGRGNNNNNNNNRSQRSVDPALEPPRQEYDFNARDGEEDPWLTNDEDTARRQLQNQRTSSFPGAATSSNVGRRSATTAMPNLNGRNPRDLGADEIMAMVAQAQQEAVEAAGLHYDEGGALREDGYGFDDDGQYDDEGEEEQFLNMDDAANDETNVDDDEGIPEVVRLMRVARRNRQQIIKDFDAHNNTAGDADDVDEEGNPVVLLPNIDDYLMELENEEMELELHEISEQLRAVTTTNGDEDEFDGVGEDDDRLTVIEERRAEQLSLEYAQQMLDRIVAAACRRSRQKRHRRKMIRVERQFVSTSLEIRRSHVTPSQHRHVDPSGSSLVVLSAATRTSSYAARSSVSPDAQPRSHDQKENSKQRKSSSRTPSSRQPLSKSLPPQHVHSTSASVLVADNTHRFQTTSLGETLHRAYLPSVMDLM